MHIDTNNKLSQCLEWVSSSVIEKNMMERRGKTERERIKKEKSLAPLNTVKLQISLPTCNVVGTWKKTTPQLDSSFRKLKHAM